MCGFAFFWQRVGSSTDELFSLASGMARTLIHRGPDDEGVFTDADCGLGIGFRRLAIQDLTLMGRQPMVSESGRFVIAFNGEVYNFLELKHHLAGRGHRFRGSSDTEVILAGVEEWGFRAALRRFNGMFAIALWDRQERILSLARDAMGIKPVYYGWFTGTLLAGSELKALRAHPDFRAEVDPRALMLFLRYGYVPAPYCIYKNVLKLAPGCVASFRHAMDRPAPEQFWSLKEVVERGAGDSYHGTEEDALDELHELLRDSVRQQMLADVTVGSFLSGGVDSSLLTALMQAQSSRPIRTCTIEFDEADFDEGPLAKQVAQHLGTDHASIRVSSATALEVIPRLPDLFDEPFADTAQIPGAVLAAAARTHVTVAISGEGGDELFCGYTHQAALQRIWDRYQHLPRCARRSLGALMRQAGEVMANAPVAWLRHLGDGSLAHAMAVASRTPAEYCVRYAESDRQLDRLCRRRTDACTFLSDAASWPDIESPTLLSLFFDTALGLPDDMLVKGDRTTSAASLELRVPFLDTRVVELSWRLPLTMKLREGIDKWVLRQLLARYLPENLCGREKHGFSVPISQWLRGPLRPWAEDLLSDAFGSKHDPLSQVFDVGSVLHLWRSHVSGRANHEKALWRVLMFLSWTERWKSPIRATPDSAWERSTPHSAHVPLEPYVPSPS